MARHIICAGSSLARFAFYALLGVLVTLPRTIIAVVRAVVIAYFALILAGVVTGDKISESYIQSGERVCGRTFYVTPLMWRHPTAQALVLPVFTDAGDTIIFSRTDALFTVLHEYKHTEQVCQYGAFQFYFRYLASSLLDIGNFDEVMEAEAYAAEHSQPSEIRHQAAGR